MNAMLEPRIVAASTHGLDLAVHGAPEIPDRITDSSQGGLIINLDADGIGRSPVSATIEYYHNRSR
ncbi:MAG TPA: hypothetical protein VHS80_17430 [Chthoniobacterales bacterium]|jgi:hypothetical protein|nr:hypothetical protein [Chthoniobacterales bacterium]